MVDVNANLHGDVINRVKEHIHEDHYYKFMAYEEEGAVLKDKKDQQDWNILHHYVHLSENVDKTVLDTLLNDQGL